MWDVHDLHYASLTACSLSTLVTPQCNISPQWLMVHPVSKFRSCHKTNIMMTMRAHCYPWDNCGYLYCGVILFGELDSTT